MQASGQVIRRLNYLLKEFVGSEEIPKHRVGNLLKLCGLRLQPSM